MSLRDWLPETYLGFPMKQTEDVDQPNRTMANQSRSRGVAMIIAIMVIATLLIFTSDMIINSTVSARLAEAARDDVKAEYMAKSGINLGIFLTTLDWAVGVAQFQYMKKLPTDGQSGQNLYTQLNDKPIDEQLAKSAGIARNAAAGMIEQLKSFDGGGFQVNVSDEMSRINVNNCVVGRGDTCLNMLDLLFSGPAEKAFVEKRKLTGRNIAAALKDWADFDNVAEPWASYTNEKDPYSNREPKIDPKNAPFDSLEEIKMVDGVDDELYAVFSPYLTVYPIALEGQVPGKPVLNINTVSEELMRNLFPDGSKNCAENFTKVFNPTDDQPRPEAGAAKEIETMMSGKICSNDKSKMKWFTFRSDVFRIRSVGVVRNQRKRIEAVIQRGIPESTLDANDPNAKEKVTYNILYWKML